jgi:hypothetical protein
MAYQVACSVSFGTGKAGLATVGYALYNVGGTLNTARTTTGVVDLGAGSYGANVSFPDSFNGYIEWDTGEATPAYAVEPVHPRLWENLDVKISTRSSMGTGAYTVNITVQDNSSNAVQGVLVTVKDSTETLVVAQGTTSSAGLVSANLDPGTYKVVVSSPVAYQVLATQTLSVSANPTAVTYTLTPVSVSSPVAPGLCVVYGYVYKNGSPVSGATVRATLQVNEAYTSSVLLSTEETETTTSVLGYFELQLVRSDQFTRGSALYRIEIDECDIDEVIIVPSSANVDFRTLIGL